MTNTPRLAPLARRAAAASAVRIALIAAVAAAALGLAATGAAAPIEVAGDWDQPGGGIFGFQEEFLDRGVDPISATCRAADQRRASLQSVAHSPSWLTVPERQCLPHPSTYQYRSPGGLSIVKEYDAVTQRLVAYHVYGSYGLARTVWMDGRPCRERAAHVRGLLDWPLGGDELIVETVT